MAKAKAKNQLCKNATSILQIATDTVNAKHRLSSETLKYNATNCIHRVKEIDTQGLKSSSFYNKVCMIFYQTVIGDFFFTKRSFENLNLNFQKKKKKKSINKGLFTTHHLNDRAKQDAFCREGWGCASSISGSALPP